MSCRPAVQDGELLLVRVQPVAATACALRRDALVSQALQCRLGSRPGDSRLLGHPGDGHGDTAPSTTSMRLTSSRPTRPFPSKKGWIVSNCACASPALITGAVRPYSSWRKRSKLSSAALISCGGGGTKRALPGRVPPTQFWVRRNSPGAWLPPRAPFIKTP